MEHSRFHRGDRPRRPFRRRAGFAVPISEETRSAWERVPLSARAHDLAAVRAEDDEPAAHSEGPV